MKKSTIYNVDIIIDTSGQIVGTQCECGAGMAPSAHCKHVCCLLLGLITFTSGGDLLIKETCTQQLQTFHHCKRFKGSPIKAQNLSLREQKEQESSSSLNANFDPRPPKYRNMSNYTTNFKNICINYSSTHAWSMPVLNLFPPANIYAINNDHQYSVLSMEERFLHDNYLVGIKSDTKITENDSSFSVITKTVQKTIEQDSREQSSSKNWFKVRAIRISSSHFGKICKATDRRDKDKLAFQIMRQEEINSAPVCHGIKNEPIAVKKIEELKNITTSKCGTFISLTHPFLCSSPDRIIDNETVMEVKCPFTARDKHISATTVPYLLEENGQLILNSHHDYYFQVQGQLFCSERQRCLFVVYTLNDIHSQYIERDNNFIEAMVTKLSEFYSFHFEKAMLKKHLFLDYDDYSFTY